MKEVFLDKHGKNWTWNDMRMINNSMGSLWFYENDLRLNQKRAYEKFNYADNFKGVQKQLVQILWPNYIHDKLTKYFPYDLLHSILHFLFKIPHTWFWELLIPLAQYQCYNSLGDYIAREYRWENNYKNIQFNYNLEYMLSAIAGNKRAIENMFNSDYVTYSLDWIYREKEWIRFHEICVCIDAAFKTIIGSRVLNEKIKDYTAFQGENFWEWNYLFNLKIPKIHNLPILETELKEWDLELAQDIVEHKKIPKKLAKKHQSTIRYMEYIQNGRERYLQQYS